MLLKHSDLSLSEFEIEYIPVLQICPHPPALLPKREKGSQIKVSLPLWERDLG
jgi:hypothetical protein